MDKQINTHPAIEAEVQRLKKKMSDSNKRIGNAAQMKKYLGEDAEIWAKKSLSLAEEDFDFVASQKQIAINAAYYIDIQKSVGRQLKVMSLIVDYEARRLRKYLNDNKCFNKESAFCPDRYRFYYTDKDERIWICNENIGWSYKVLFSKGNLVTPPYCEVVLWNASSNDTRFTSNNMERQKGMILSSDRRYHNDQLLTIPLYRFLNDFSHAIEAMGED